MAHSSTQATTSSQNEAMDDVVNGYNDENGVKFESPHAMYKRFLQIVLNESTAPELLNYEEYIVDGLVEQIEHMTKNLRKFRNKLEKFCIEQHELELERFKYILCKYHRTRIEKIERNASHLVRTLKSDRSIAEKLMSPDEIKYLDRYVTSIEGHIQATVLSHMPTSINSFKLSDVPFNSRLEYDTSYVFVEALTDTTVTVDDQSLGMEVIDLKKGSKYFLPYSAVRSHILSSSSDLLLL